MTQASQAPVLRRIKGGFRQLIETELGAEQLCRSCGDSWPTDSEFFTVTANSMGYECKACTAERRGPRRAILPDHDLTRVSEQLTIICFVFFQEKNKKSPYVQI
jgi:hypothetical protein